MQVQENVRQVPIREVELERKLRILEARIGELHREKQEAVARMNEENRKIYHENTSLKLRLSDLARKYEEKQESKSDRSTSRKL